MGRRYVEPFGSGRGVTAAVHLMDDGAAYAHVLDAILADAVASAAHEASEGGKAAEPAEPDDRHHCRHPGVSAVL